MAAIPYLIENYILKELNSEVMLLRAKAADVFY